MIEAIAWWFALEILGLISLPLAFLLFHRLPDRGYTLSKALGLLAISYLLWLSASLGLLPNSRGSIVLLLIALGAVNLYLLGRCQGFLAELRRRASLIATAEVLFTALFFLCVFARAHNPDIAATEKPMDFAFLNAILRSEHFPPHDPWLSGYTISYYYFGYLMAAVLTCLSGVAPSIGFNLALASLLALAALGAFGLGYGLIAGEGGRARALGLGLLAAFLLVGLANLEGLLELLYAHGWGSGDFWSWVTVKGLASPYQSAHWYPDQPWWWWRATRVIDTVVAGKSLDYAITEFPFFSFLLGDLHPHVMALPFGMLALALSLNLHLSPEAKGLAWARDNTARLLGVAICLGALGFLNSWDFPTYALILLGTLFLNRGGAGLGQCAIVAVVVVALSLALYTPFYGGMAVSLGAGAAEAGLGLPVGLWGGPGTRPWHFLLLWGPLAFAIGCYLFSAVRGGWALALAVIVLWVVGEASGVGMLSPLARRLWLALPLAAAGMLWAARRRTKDMPPQETQRFVLLVVVVALLLLWGCEFFYIRDVFGNRMNTVFKFYYQAWALLAIASAYALYYLSQRLRGAWRLLWGGSLGLLILAASVYPIASLMSKTDAFSGTPNLDGLAFVARGNAAEYRAVQWLNNEVPGAPVIAEAVGEEWGEYSRVSARTGLPTVLGWAGHEVQWRGSERPFRDREEDVARLYRSQDPAEVAAIVAKYGISYVYVGHLERAKYSLLGVFPRLMTAAFQGDGVTIYKVVDGGIGR